MGDKFMISKEAFLQIINLIRKQEEIDRKVTKGLELVTDGYFIYGTNNKYLKALLLALKEVFCDKYSYIEWWLYETNDYKVWDDKSKWNLKKPEDLYDYLVEHMK